LHDAVAAEQVGTPSIAVMTDAFVSGATLMASALGHAGYPFVVIKHPIASASDRELLEQARATIEQATRLLRL
jgi:hypothetical protein